MKFLENKRNVRFICNVLIILLSLMFFFTLIANYNKINNNVIYGNSAYEEAKKNALLNNKTVINDEVSEEQKEKPIFANAREAIIKSYNNYLALDSFSVLQEGTTITSTPIGDWKVVSKFVAGKWKDGKMFSCLEAYQISGNKTFFNKTDGIQVYTENNVRYERSTKNISYSNNVFTSVFNNDFIAQKDYDDIFPISYDFNEKTITNIYSYKVCYDNSTGKITSYDVSFSISPDGAQKFAEAVYKGADGKVTVMPKFKQLKFGFKINAKGELQNIKVDEIYEIKVPVIGWSPITDDFLFTIYDQNQTPSISLPTINK